MWHLLGDCGVDVVCLALKPSWRWLLVTFEWYLFPLGQFSCLPLSIQHSDELLSDAIEWGSNGTHKAHTKPFAQLR